MCGEGTEDVHGYGRKRSRRCVTFWDVLEKPLRSSSPFFGLSILVLENSHSFRQGRLLVVLKTTVSKKTHLFSWKRNVFYLPSKVSVVLLAEGLDRFPG